MQFEQQTIEIKLSDQTSRPTPVMVAPGTGLAYHHAHGDTNNGYVLSHIRTGYSLVCIQVATKEDAQRWLEKVIPLADWTQDWSELRHVVSFRTIQQIEGMAKSVRITTTCQACGKQYDLAQGYYETGEYSYCSECCWW